ncbi:FtsQ-type POTRA domain-containing protein [Nocardioidaceae bacterium]|nr:FtsQ-type POTRA domain-containing protein [Nocardioidaceae bacterium]
MTATRPVQAPHGPDHRRRFSRRSWQRRWRRARPLLALALVLAAVGGVVWLFFFSTTFAATTVEVEGSAAVDDAAIRAAAEAPLGGPLARVDLDAIEQRVAELPALAEVRVSRGWPDAIRVVVTDRVPVAAIETNGRWRMVDADGFVWGRSATAPRNLPVVRAGGEVRQSAVAEAARVVTSLPGSLAQDVSEVQVRTIDQISLQIQDGPLVQWGSAEQSQLKAEVLATMLGSDEAMLIDEEPAGEVDVSVPAQPTISR